MRKFSRVARVYLVQAAAALFVGGISFFLTILVARSLGPQSFGIYSVAMAAGALITLFVDGGLRTLVLRERSKPTELFSIAKKDLPGLAISFGAIVALIFCVIATLAFRGEILLLALSTILCFFVVSLCLINSAILRGDGRMLADAWFQCISRTITAVAVALVVISGFEQLWKIFLAWGIAGFLTLLPYRSLWGKPLIRGLSKIFKFALPFFLFELSITIYIRSDILILQSFGIDSADIGEFAAAFKICEAFILVAAPVGLIVFRHFRINHDSNNHLFKSLQSLLLSALVLGAFCFLLVLFCTDLITLLIFGDQYLSSGEFLRHMCPMILFILPNMVLNQFALATGKERICMGVAIFVALFNLGLSYLLIPVFGISVAPFVKTITEATVFILMVIVLFGPNVIARLKNSPRAC